MVVYCETCLSKERAPSASAVRAYPSSFYLAILVIQMTETFRGDVSFILLHGFQREVLVCGQYLSDSHINTSGFQVAGTHVPVLYRTGLYHRVSGQDSWERCL